MPQPTILAQLFPEIISMATALTDRRLALPRDFLVKADSFLDKLENNAHIFSEILAQKNPPNNWTVLHSNLCALQETAEFLAHKTSWSENVTGETVNHQANNCLAMLLQLINASR